MSFSVCVCDTFKFIVLLFVMIRSDAVLVESGRQREREREMEREKKNNGYGVNDFNC